MRSGPHCAGCDEPIRWNQQTVPVTDRDFYVYFHRRCLATWEKAQKGGMTVNREKA